MPKKGYKQTNEHRKKVREAMKLFSDKEEQEIGRQYKEEKVSVYTLSKRYKCDPTTIWNAVKKWSKLRTHKENVNTISCLELRKQNNSFYTAGENHPSKRLRGKNNPFYGKHHTEEFKCKNREKALLRMQNHFGPFKNTKPELKMKEILTSLNIPFKHQFILNNCSFDFHLLNTNILIEVDGDYYHANPKLFQKLNKMQLEMKERDIKHNEVAKENNFVLLRFWEDDILNNENEVKEKICYVIKEKVNKDD